MLLLLVMYGANMLVLIKYGSFTILNCLFIACLLLMLAVHLAINGEENCAQKSVSFVFIFKNLHNMLHIKVKQLC